MTYLEVVFNYGAIPGENELRAIDRCARCMEFGGCSSMRKSERCEWSSTHRG